MYRNMYVRICGLLSATFGQSTTFVLHHKPRTSRDLFVCSIQIISINCLFYTLLKKVIRIC